MRTLLASIALLPVVLGAACSASTTAPKDETAPSSDEATADYGDAGIPLDEAGVEDQAGFIDTPLLDLQGGDNADAVDANPSDLIPTDTTPDTWVVGPDGGLVQFPAVGPGGVRLEIPAGAVEGTVVLSVTPAQELTNQSVPVEVSASPEAETVAVAVELGPEGTIFQRPIAVELTLPTPGTPRSMHRIYLRDREKGVWTTARMQDGSVIDGVVGAAGTAVVFLTDHFSTYAVGSLETIFCSPGWATDFPLAVPCSYYSESAFAAAGTDVMLLESARKSMYVQVLKELVVRTERPRSSAETGLTETFFKSVGGVIKDEPIPYKKVLKGAKYLQQMADDALASGVPALLEFTPGLKALSDGSKFIQGETKWFSTVLEAADCVVEGLLKVFALHAVDYPRALARLDATQTYLVESNLYKKDPAFRAALAQVRSDIEFLQSSVAAQIVEALPKIGEADCGMSILKSLFKFAMGPLLVALKGTGAGLVASVIFEFVVVDVVMDDMVAATQKGLALAALGTIYVHGGLYEATKDLINITPLTWQSEALRTKLMALQVSNYANLAIHKSAAEVMRMEGAGWLNKNLTGVVDWTGTLFGTVSREDIAKVHDKRQAELEANDRAIRDSYPGLCDGEGLLPAVCGSTPGCLPVCGLAVCGDDGCGGSCGTCPVGQTCSEAAQCVVGGCEANCGEMVAVGAGTFWQGCNEAMDIQCNGHELPFHEVTVPVFQIDKYEVTARSYDDCVNAGWCAPLVNATYSPWCNWGVAGKEEYPVNCINWYEARNYCAWAGKRLCSESEWEKASRGTDERIYPWGNETATCDYTVMYEGGYGCGTGGPLVVGSKPAGASPYGALDMGGNVFEWLEDDWHSDYSNAPTDGSAWVDDPRSSSKLGRGGSFYYADTSYQRSSSRSYQVPADYQSSYDFGVRCCYSPDCPANKDCANRDCGPDPVCGESCGTCSAGTCSAEGKCIVPKGEMVTVPAGPFMMGCTPTLEGNCRSYESPYHEVSVPRFEIDKNEVRLAEYRACVEAGGCSEPETRYSTQCNWNQTGMESYPVNCLYWSQARAYCAWAGKRLCSESEWEKAARGTDGRVFPWGEDSTPCCDYAVADNGVTDGCGTGSLWPVGSKPLGASPYGVLDMVGNVAEWIEDDWHFSYEGAPSDGSPWVESPRSDGRIRRGGEYREGCQLASLRSGFEGTGGWSEGSGARCCRSLPPTCPADKNCTNRVCGPDPICGESCGTCSTGACSTEGQCVLPVAEMVAVPAGPFMMGCNASVDTQCDSDEYPYHQVDVPLFEIDKYEVMVTEYAACVTAGACTAPYPNSSFLYCNWGAAGKDRHPVNCVTWDQSQAYCAWAGKRMCSESEWEKAARGTDGRVYPWGNEPASCQYAVMDDGGGWGCGTVSTMAVGSKPAGTSPCGAMDMAGNVGEWVQDRYHADYAGAPADGSAWDSPAGSRTIGRGGYSGFGPYFLRASVRGYAYDSDFGKGVGARCCRSP